jgi:hypothetical protein
MNYFTKKYERNKIIIYLVIRYDKHDHGDKKSIYQI